MPTLENVSEKQISEFTRYLGEKLGRIADAHRLITERVKSVPPEKVWSFAIQVAYKEMTIEGAISSLMELPTPRMEVRDVSMDRDSSPFYLFGLGEFTPYNQVVEKQQAYFPQIGLDYDLIIRSKTVGNSPSFGLKDLNACLDIPLG